MPRPTWMPAIPLRFVERDGKRILQQAWVLHVYGADHQWFNSSQHEWRDVPMMTEGQSDPRYWSQEVMS